MLFLRSEKHNEVMLQVPALLQGTPLTLAHSHLSPLKYYSSQLYHKLFCTRVNLLPVNV